MLLRQALEQVRQSHPLPVAFHTSVYTNDVGFIDEHGYLHFVPVPGQSVDTQEVRHHLEAFVDSGRLAA